MTRVALCQMPISVDPLANLDRVLDAVRRAAAEGAQLAVFPEATMSRFGPHIREAAEPLDGPFVTALRELARNHEIALIAGVMEPAGDGRVYNTAVALERDGSLRGTYRKIHLFDAFNQRESEHVAPGDELVTVHLADLRIGLITCYDVRFPELARALVDQGADTLVIIAAWGSGPYKEEHWTTLVRARAIENTCWTVAVGQAPNPQARDGFGIGRSLLINPLGVVRADLGPYDDVHVGEIDHDVTTRVRNTLPCLEHRRLK